VRRLAFAWVVGLVLAGGLAGAATAQADYRAVVDGTPGLLGYWRLGDAAGTVAADATGRVPGSYSGGVALGARGALNGDPDTAALFDGADDALEVGAASLTLPATIEGWFFWEGGVALLRDATSSGGWILAYDNGGSVAYRVGGKTFTTPLATENLRNGWHHVVLTVSGGSTRFYVDRTLVHTGTGAGTAAAVMPWRVMRNGTVPNQSARGRADEVALYGTALSPSRIEQHFQAGRDVTDTTPPPAPTGLTATARLGLVALDWADAADTVDGYDVYRATAAGGPYTRINASRLFASAYTDLAVSGGTTYRYVVTASDVANNRSAYSNEATATPASSDDLLHRYAPQLRYETQESYFADSAAEMTDNYVAGRRENYLVGANGSRIAAADPADPLPQLELGFLADQQYANGSAATTSDYLDEANGSYQQDAQRMRAAGYGDRAYGRVVVSQGKTWLQYWLFYYYNPQNVLGFGVHEGDWESIQVGLDADGMPDSAVYAQHGDGERCTWGQVERDATGAPVVYVALASHASYFQSGVNPRGIYPDDYHRGTGLAVRPALEVVTAAPGFLAWRGRWGASSSSPIAPRRQGNWTDPSGFAAGAAACTVGAVQAHASAVAARESVPAPQLRVVRDGGRVTVRYGFARMRGRDRPHTLLVSVGAVGHPGTAVARRVRVLWRHGTLVLPARGGRAVVRASAFSRRGARSRLATVVLP
jgi:hypothetical protein